MAAEFVSGVNSPLSQRSLHIGIYIPTLSVLRTEEEHFGGVEGTPSLTQGSQTKSQDNHSHAILLSFWHSGYRPNFIRLTQVLCHKKLLVLEGKTRTSLLIYKPGYGYGGGIFIQQ